MLRSQRVLAGLTPDALDRSLHAARRPVPGGRRPPVRPVRGPGPTTSTPPATSPSSSIRLAPDPTSSTCPVAAPLFVVVSGPPGSGKSTVAEPLARELGAAADRQGHDQGGVDGRRSARRTSRRRSSWARPPIEVLLAVAAASPVGAVLDCNFRRSLAVGDLGRLPGAVVEVFCRVDEDVAVGALRGAGGTRHPGHFDEERARGEPWGDEVSEPVAGGWPVLEVDTSRPGGRRRRGGVRAGSDGLRPPLDSIEQVFDAGRMRSGAAL